MIRRRSKEDKVRGLAVKRLQRLPDIDVLNWSEQAVNGMHQALDAYRRERDTAALEEARRAASMLAGVVDVLESRQQS